MGVHCGQVEGHGMCHMVSVVTEVEDFGSRVLNRNGGLYEITINE